MHIQFELDGQESPNELTAIMALCASLGGRLPAGAAAQVGEIRIEASTADGLRHILAESTSSRVEDGVLVVGDVDESPATPPADPSERDTAGLPWDERIHASSRTKNADGSWRQRRNVAAELVTAVTAELSSARPTEAPPAPPAPSDGPASAAPTAPAPPAAPVAEAAPPPPPAQAAGGYPPFKRFQALTKVTGALGKVYADLNPIAQAIGLSAYADVAKNEDRIDDYIAMAVGLDILPADTQAQYEARLAESMAA